MWITPIILGITWALAISGALLGAFSMIDALSRRPDAFPAADKQTKGLWVGITVASAVVLILGLISGFFEPQGMLWLAAVIGSTVYLVDVRPKLRGVSGPGRW